MKTLRFGIEIETVGLSKEGAARAIAAVVGGAARPAGNGWEAVAADGRVWRAVPDGSLSGYQNAEIVSPILGYADMETLQNVVRALHAAGGRADASCGIHIHIDGARFDAKELTSLAKIVHKQERLIEAALGIQAHRLQRFCRPLDTGFIERLEARRPRTVAEVNAAWYGHRVHAPSRYDQSRYHGVNLNSYFFRGTIEFRYFEGTTHAGKVKAYVQFCLALAAKALGAKSASSRRREYNPATAKYDFRVFLLSLGMVGEEFKT
ncbi:MAG: amidoligase family protein, partial [Polyangiaceae bacterium]